MKRGQLTEEAQDLVYAVRKILTLAGVMKIWPRGASIFKTVRGARNLNLFKHSIPVQQESVLQGPKLPENDYEKTGRVWARQRFVHVAWMSTSTSWEWMLRNSIG